MSFGRMRSRARPAPTGYEPLDVHPSAVAARPANPLPYTQYALPPSQPEGGALPGREGPMSNGLLAALMLIVGVVAGALIAVGGLRPRASTHRALPRAPVRPTTRVGDGRVTVNTQGTRHLRSCRGDQRRALLQRAVARIGAMGAISRSFQRDLSVLSHDINTPLTGAKGYLQLASDESDSLLPRQRRLDAAVKRIDRTSELLDALFSYTKASDPDLELDLEPVDVRDIVERCLLGALSRVRGARAWSPPPRGVGRRGSSRPTDRLSSASSRTSW